MFVSADIVLEHETNMGNSFPVNPKLEDQEVDTYLGIYRYVIPIVAIFIVIVNLSVVLSSGLLIKKGVEPRYTYLFLGNVAMTDMITGVSVLFSQFYPDELINHRICAFQIGMIVSSAIASIYSVGLLAVDRFLYIVYGIKYCKWISVRRVRIVIMLTWIMAITIGFLPLTGWSGDTSNGTLCWFIFLAPDPLILFTVSIGIIPIILVIILYSIILYHAIANIKKIQYSVCTINTISEKIASMEKLRMFRGNTEVPIKPNKSQRKESDSHVPHKWKAIKVVLFTTFSFVLTWAPYFIACVIYVSQKCNLGEHTDFCKSLALLIASPLTILGITNSLINPLIYAWWHNGFRTYMKKRVKICCRYQPSTKTSFLTTALFFRSRHPWNHPKDNQDPDIC